MRHPCHEVDKNEEAVNILMYSIGEPSPVPEKTVKLEFIGKRGVTIAVTAGERVQYEIGALKLEFFRHVGIEAGCEIAKVTFKGTCSTLFYKSR